MLYFSKYLVIGLWRLGKSLIIPQEMRTKVEAVDGMLACKLRGRGDGRSNVLTLKASPGEPQAVQCFSNVDMKS